jgi:hypothetical protein
MEEDESYIIWLLLQDQYKLALAVLELLASRFGQWENDTTA